jgi:hypothetical protein
MLESFTSLFLGPSTETIPKKTKPLKKTVEKKMDKKPITRNLLPKKSVGRPRKNPVDIKMPKKSVGRPRTIPEVAKVPKKSVGRPQKIHNIVKVPKEKAKPVGRPVGRPLGYIVK